MVLLFKLLFLMTTIIMNVKSSNENNTKMMISHCSFDVIRKNKIIPSLDGLVGIGWDNLLNKPMPHTFINTFSKCRTTPDGEFLVPDHIQVLPIKRIKMTKQAEYYGNFKDAFEKTTYSLNLDASLPKIAELNIGGSFSAKYETTKTNMASNEITMFITQLDYHAYTLIAQASSELDPIFKERLLSINLALDKNLIDRARYLAETIIRDYGTHALTRVQAGARIEEIDYFNSSIINSMKTSLTDIKDSVSISFLEKFGSISRDYKYINDNKLNETISQSKRYSEINTFGDPNVNALFAQSLDVKNTQRAKFVIEDLVALDVNGMLLYELINENHLKDIKPTRVYEIMGLLRNATNLYYIMNLYPGCMDQNAPNYNYMANHDDGSCLKSYNNFTFGGYYQTCKTSALVPNCHSDLNQVNPITGKNSCPIGFNSIQLYSGIHDKILGNIEYKIYWCQAQNRSIGSEKGFMFGGIYIENEINPVTGESTCPQYYKPYRFTGQNVIICLSQDYKKASSSEVKFSGLFSCQSEIKQCEEGYSQQTFGLFNGCEMNYCIRPEAFKKKFPQIRRPPFEDISALEYAGEEKDISFILDSKNDERKESFESNSLNYIYFIGAAAIIFVALVAFVWWRRTKNKNNNMNRRRSEEFKQRANGNDDQAWAGMKTPGRESGNPGFP